MARYSAAQTKAAPTAGTAICDLRTGASNRARLLELGIFSKAATALDFGIIRSATVGTASTTTAGQPEDTAEAVASAVMGTAWSSAPTITAMVYHRLCYLPANAGAGVIFTFGGEGLVIPVSSSLLVWAVTAGPILGVYMNWDE